MKVFKFGGASVKNAKAIQNAKKIIDSYSEDLIVVVSAIDKTTNALEKLVSYYFNNPTVVENQIAEIYSFHKNILLDLFPDPKNLIYKEIESLFLDLTKRLEITPDSQPYNFVYDQVVSLGEDFSTKILAAYLRQENSNVLWIDAKTIIRTDSNYRYAKVDWEKTRELSEQYIKSHFNKEQPTIIVSQGFIGADEQNNITTLGREGSDFSAAIFANCLDAEQIIFWKDVDGLLNADPKFFENTKKINQISYKEAIELSYLGASVIHPKTVKPLQNKLIPLIIKSFVNPDSSGTRIEQIKEHIPLIPCIVYKPNQTLFTISPKDFSFIGNSHLEEVFSCLKKYNIRSHLMQNSAINFSLVFDDTTELMSLIKMLEKNYHLKYNSSLKLLSIRNYNEKVVDDLQQGKTIYLEQKTRQVAKFLFSD